MPIQAALPRMVATTIARMVVGIVIAVQMRVDPVSLSAPQTDGSTMPTARPPGMLAQHRFGAASLDMGPIWTEITTAWVVSSRG